MPKHLPTFKHLLHSTQTDQKAEPKQKSVNDLISSSRNARPVAGSSRDVPPHLAGERVWSPSSTSSTTGSAGGLVDVEEGGVHPAEILRRSNIAQRQASRYVAGPAPPPSWRPTTTSSGPSSSSTSQVDARAIAPKDQPVTTDQLTASSALLSASPSHSSRPSQSDTLVKFCFMAVLRHLEDERVIYTPDEDGLGGEGIYTLGRLLREQIPYLSSPLKSAFLDIASTLPSNYPHRLSDRAFLAILSETPAEEHHVESQSSDTSTVNDWDIPPISDTAISHLPITLHPSPHQLLSRISELNSITSLNLAYSTLPSDMDKLVSVLPAGLRELGLVGIRFGGKTVDDLNLRRGFSALSRKLIVLRMLVLSHPRFDLTMNILEGLLSPGNSKLPSLRTLGLRGLTDSPHSDNGQTTYREVEKRACEDEKDWQCGVKISRQEVIAMIKASGRNKYVEVIWS
ncbi:uncharacterized protein I303_108023 [Kwoniella dejecticola CBS 10117]|uniref:Uncharacterized protein n=1 Tax=Kwoniella dejecticola CBS 10117 TaxID=1296121 RepID=A0A1A5ZWB6_9TREE|nr:uncharacterized protein I303_08014 [Kwoniella dejecticola CBS 10117]OBR82100.1 hypothetical protein I303_08014 [Kwoniella dejecticola CBS 10117]